MGNIILKISLPVKISWDIWNALAVGTDIIWKNIECNWICHYLKEVMIIICFWFSYLMWSLWSLNTFKTVLKRLIENNLKKTPFFSALFAHCQEAVTTEVWPERKADQFQRKTVLLFVVVVPRRRVHKVSLSILFWVEKLLQKCV